VSRSLWGVGEELGGDYCWLVVGGRSMVHGKEWLAWFLMASQAGKRRSRGLKVTMVQIMSHLYL